MADAEMAFERGERALVEHVRDQAHVLVDPQHLAVAGGDAGGFLTPVLEGMETEVQEGATSRAGGVDPHDPAGLLSAQPRREPPTTAAGVSGTAGRPGDRITPPRTPPGAGPSRPPGQLRSGDVQDAVDHQAVAPAPA